MTQSESPIILYDTQAFSIGDIDVKVDKPTQKDIDKWKLTPDKHVARNARRMALLIPHLTPDYRAGMKQLMVRPSPFWETYEKDLAPTFTSTKSYINDPICNVVASCGGTVTSLMTVPPCSGNGMTVKFSDIKEPAYYAVFKDIFSPFKLKSILESTPKSAPFDVYVVSQDDVKRLRTFFIAKSLQIFDVNHMPPPSELEEKMQFKIVPMKATLKEITGKGKLAIGEEVLNQTITKPVQQPNRNELWFNIMRILRTTHFKMAAEGPKEKLQYEEKRQIFLSSQKPAPNGHPTPAVTPVDPIVVKLTPENKKNVKLDNRLTAPSTKKDVDDKTLKDIMAEKKKEKEAKEAKEAKERKDAEEKKKREDDERLAREKKEEDEKKRLQEEARLAKEKKDEEERIAKEREKKEEEEMKKKEDERIAKEREKKEEDERLERERQAEADRIAQERLEEDEAKEEREKIEKETVYASESLPNPTDYYNDMDEDSKKRKVEGDEDGQVKRKKKKIQEPEDEGYRSEEYGSTQPNTTVPETPPEVNAVLPFWNF